MISAARSVNFPALVQKLTTDTGIHLTAFSRKHADLTKSLKDLTEQDAKSIDFDSYRSVLKNSKVVDNAEQALKSQKVDTIDLKQLLSSITTERTKAIATANATVSSIAVELASMKELLVHIDTSRPLEELTIEDAFKAVPQLDKDVEVMVMRSQWEMPGYKEKFGTWKLGF